MNWPETYLTSHRIRPHNDAHGLFLPPFREEGMVGRQAYSSAVARLRFA